VQYQLMAVSSHQNCLNSFHWVIIRERCLSYTYRLNCIVFYATRSRCKPTSGGLRRCHEHVTRAHCRVNARSHVQRSRKQHALPHFLAMADVTMADDFSLFSGSSSFVPNGLLTEAPFVPNGLLASSTSADPPLDSQPDSQSQGMLRIAVGICLSHRLNRRNVAFSFPVATPAFERTFLIDAGRGPCGCHFCSCGPFPLDHSTCPHQSDNFRWKARLPVKEKKDYTYGECEHDRRCSQLAALTPPMTRSPDRHLRTWVAC